MSSNKEIFYPLSGLIKAKETTVRASKYIKSLKIYFLLLIKQNPDISDNQLQHKVTTNPIWGKHHRLVNITLARMLVDRTVEISSTEHAGQITIKKYRITDGGLDCLTNLSKDTSSNIMKLCDIEIIMMMLGNTNYFNKILDQIDAELKSKNDFLANQNLSHISRLVLEKEKSILIKNMLFCQNALAHLQSSPVII